MKTSFISKQTNQVKFIAYLQVIGIILMVIGHSLHEYPIDHGDSSLVHRLIYSFHMPLFMLASGFLLTLTYGRRTYSKFLLNKIQRLIIPFITLTLVTFVPRAMMSGIADDNLELTPISFVLALTHGHHLVFPNLWFNQGLFIMMILFGAVIAISKRINIHPAIMHISLIILFTIIPLTGLELTNWFSICSVSNLGIFFAIGMAYCHWQNAIDRVLPWTSWWFILLCGVAWGVLFAIGGNWVTNTLTALAGTAMCISVSKILEARHIRWLDHLTGANYIIFLLSWYMNVAFQQVLHHFVELPWWIYTALSIIAGIYVPWLVLKLMIRHRQHRTAKIAAMLLGQKLPRE